MARSFDDELHLYRATIVDNKSFGDDRLQVRIMPHMADIEETENLPVYPSFFKGKVVRGYTEAEPGPDGFASSIYVLASNDFTFGYVLGVVNELAGILSGALESSWNYQEIKGALSQAGVCPDDFDYEEVEVDFNEAANVIIMRSYKNPFYIIMTSRGSMIVLNDYKITLLASAGASSTDGSDDTQKSWITIDPTSIEIAAELVDLSKSKAVVLGHHGLSVVGTLSTETVGYDGINFTPIDKIQL